MHRRQPSRCSCTLPLSRLDSPDRMNAPRCSLTHRQSVVGQVRDVHGQEGLAEPLAGAVGQRGHRVGAHPEQRGDVGGLLALDLEVPQHELPALGQRGERLRGRAALEAGDGGVLERHARVERRQVVGGVQPLPGAHPVDVQPAYGGQQVGAEGDVRAATALQHDEHLGERLGDQVVGVGAADQLAGQPVGGGLVPAEQVAVGSDVPPTHARDQLGVAGRVYVAQEIGHGALGGGDGPGTPS